jgi:hypothetical protein
LLGFVATLGDSAGASDLRHPAPGFCARNALSECE